MAQGKQLSTYPAVGNHGVGAPAPANRRLALSRLRDFFTSWGNTPEEPQSEPGACMLDALQRVWGAGFLMPGGRDFVLQLLDRLDIKEGMRIAEVGDGLGGAGCAVAQDKNVKVAEIAGSPESREMGQALWSKLDLGERITAIAYDKTKPELPRETFDHAFAKDGVPADEKLLKALNGALKPKGQLVLAQIVGERNRLDDSVAKTLASTQVGGVTSHSDVLEALKASNFQVVVDEDTTEVFLREIREGWTRFVQSLPRDPVERGDLREVLALCEQWVRAAKAFQTGELAHHTIVAKRP